MKLLFIFLLTFQYSYGQYNRCSIKVDGKCGYIDTLGNVVIEPTYEYGAQFSEGLASVRKDGCYGVIDEDENIVIGFKYLSVNRFKNGYATFQNEEGTGVMNKKEEVIVPPIYDFIYHQSENTVAVQQDDLWAFYDLDKRKFITEFKYYDVGQFINGRAMVKVGQKYGFIDRNGVLVIEAKYRQVSYRRFHEGLASVRDMETGKFGYIDTSGNVVIDFKYSNAAWFRDGFAEVNVEYNSKSLLINKEGENVFGQEFDDAWGFNGGLCSVEIDGKDGIIDTLGKWVLEPTHRSIAIYYYDGWIGYSVLTDTGTKWGILNRKGEIVVDAQYYSVVKNDGDCILPEIYVGDENTTSTNTCKKGYVNLRGEVVWEPTR